MPELYPAEALWKRSFMGGKDMRKFEPARWSKWAAGAVALFVGVALSEFASQPAAAQAKHLTL